MDLAAYLERIGCPGPHGPDLETLRKLHVAHMRSVPFENLDILLGRAVALSPAALFDKIVRRRRGGFCYELNGLFAWLLREIGFKVEFLSAGVFSDGTPGPDFAHMLLLVNLRRPVVADVGFGDSFVEPLPLDSGERRQGKHAYRLVPRGRFWDLQEQTPDSDWAPQYRFAPEPRRLEEFLPMCRYQETSPESIFTRKSICSRATPDGRITLSDGRLIVTRDDRRDERRIAGLDEFLVLCRRHFQIDLYADLAAVPRTRARRLLGPEPSEAG